MFVKYRPLRIGDLNECLLCIRDGFAYNHAARADLFALWRDLLSTGSAAGAVMEDQNAVSQHRIVWFCLKVFITDDYARYLKSTAPPIVARQVLASWRKGASPCMSLAEIRRANTTTGVTILVPNSGAPERMWTPDNRRFLTDRVAEFCSYCSAGYRCNELLQEFYDEYTTAWARGAGLRLRNDYGEFYAARSMPAPPNGSDPRLFGVTADEAALCSGTLASMLLNYQPPRFYFSSLEQDLLLEALLGETDEQLAASLGIALVTVRKRWESIYDRVTDHDGGLLLRDASDSGARSTEKKRRLLNYLRQHLEDSGRSMAVAPGGNPA